MKKNLSDDLHRRVGGYCTNNNMKVVFKVADKRSDISGNAKAVKLKSEKFPQTSSEDIFQTGLNSQKATNNNNRKVVIAKQQRREFGSGVRHSPDLQKMLRDEETRTYSYSTKVTDTQDSPNSIDRIIYRSDRKHPIESFGP